MTINKSLDERVEEGNKELNRQLITFGAISVGSYIAGRVVCGVVFEPPFSDSMRILGIISPIIVSGVTGALTAITEPKDRLLFGLYAAYNGAFSYSMGMGGALISSYLGR